MLVGVGGLFLVCTAFYGINNAVLPHPWAWVPLLVVGIFLVSGFTPVALQQIVELHRGPAFTGDITRARQPG